MTTKITQNAILQLNNGDVDLRPVLQVMDVRQIGNAQTVQERYRLVLSDSVYVQQAMLATQLNEYVKNGQVQKGSIVQLLEYICNSVQNRKIIIVLNMEVVQSIAEIVGDPKNQISGPSEQQQQQPGPPPQQLRQPPPVMQQQRAPPQPVAPPQQSSYQTMGNQPQQSSFGAVGNGNAYRAGGELNSSNMNGGGYGGQNHGGQNSYLSGPNSGPSPASGGYQAQRQMGGQPPPQQQSSYGLPPYQVPTPMYSAKGPIAKNEAPARIVPIAALNPYQGRWTIKARVTSKGDLRRYNNAKGDGKVFSFDLLDAGGGEIRCTCFNSVADQFYDRIEVGKVYMVTKGALKPSQKNYNHLKNDWEIFLENSSTIEPCKGEDEMIPKQHFDFRPISDVENLEANAMVDVVGVVIGIQDTVQIMKKNGTETLKRTLQLRDQSNKSVEMTMWGGFCNKEGDQIQELLYKGVSPIVAVKAARVSDFSGRSLGTISSSQVLINPDISEAHKLRGWYDREGKVTDAQSISREGGTGTRVDLRKTVAQIKDEGLGRGEKPDWISVRATISFIKTDNFCYTACPIMINDKQCQKKVTNNGDGSYRCDRCDQSVPKPDYRYLLQMQVQDHTGVTWISGFQEAGKEIFGVVAEELFHYKEQEDPLFGDTIQRVLFSTHVFKLKVKEETFNDEQRVKCTVVKSDKVDYAAESKLILESIKQLERGEVPNTPSIPSAAPASTAVYGSAPPVFQTPAYGGSYGGNPQGSSASMAGGYGGSAGYTGGYNTNGGSNPYGGGSSGGNSTKCYKCGKEGHFASNCLNQSQPGGFGGGGGGGGGGSCYKCGQGGHFARDCPNQGGGRSFGGGGGGGGYGGRGY